MQSCSRWRRAEESNPTRGRANRVQAGVVYTTFHFPYSGANVVTTDNSDWATNCPEYKVTAVQVAKVTEPSSWQKQQKDFVRTQEELLARARA